MDLQLKALNTLINNHALSGDKLPDIIKILDWGKSDTTKGPVYLDERSLSVFDKWQEKTGRDKDVALDFEHNTVPESDTYVPGKAVDIAAYGNPKLIEGDGLYLTDLKWTPTGEKMASNYKDLSPAAVTDKNGVVIGLHSTALTTNGAVYGLNFYSANINDMINKISKLSGGVVDYNKDGANAGVTQTGDKYVGNDVAKVVKSEIAHDENNPECECANCMSVNTVTKGLSATDGV